MSSISNSTTTTTSSNYTKQKIDIVLCEIGKFNKRGVINDSVYQIIIKELDTTTLVYLEMIYLKFEDKPSTNKIISDQEIIESLDSPLRMLGLGSLVDTVESYIFFY